MYSFKISQLFSHITPSTSNKRAIRLVKTNDIIELAGAKINSVERQLMEEVRKYSLEKGVETARVLDKRGKLHDLFTVENLNNVSVMSEDGKFFGHDFGIIGQLMRTALIEHQGTYIHSHTINIPLSGTDIIHMIRGKLKRVIATNPDGNFSYLEMPQKPKMLIKQKKYLRGANDINTAQQIKWQELGLDFDSEQGYKNVDMEKLEEYRNFSYTLLQDFANKFGFEFRTGKL